jgi:DNA-binding NarL/FixJ family response regulator
MNRITVLLAEDHTVVREGLRALLRAESDIEVVSEAENGRQAVEMSRKFRPTVVVMDIGMPLLNGLEAARQILETAPATKVLILTAHDDAAYVEQAIESSVAGFLLKQSSAHAVAMAIRELQKGNTWFGPSGAKRAGNDKALGRAGSLKRKAVHLSSREMEALQLIAESQANKQIAAELRISIKTVEKHRQRLMEKLDIHNTAGLTR